MNRLENGKLQKKIGSRMKKVIKKINYLEICNSRQKEINNAPLHVDVMKTEVLNSVIFRSA